MPPALSPPRRMQTNVSFPKYVKGTNAPILEPSASEKVTIDSCAEFLDQHISGSTFGTKTDTRLIHDTADRFPLNEWKTPMVLSIGTNQHLYLCVYVNGALGGWLAVDINPEAPFEAKVFDVTQSTNGKGMIIVVSGYGSDKSQTKVWQAILDCPAFFAPTEGNADASSTTKLPWVPVGSSIAKRNIQSLVCSPLAESRYRIVAAVDATSIEEGSYFILDSGVTQQGWKPLRLAQQVETVLSCTHGNVPKLGQGEFVLFQGASVDKETACLFQSTEGGAKAIFLTGLKNAKSLSTSVNERGLTDLWTATEDGIGYVNHMNLGEAPERLLPGIGFSKVFAVESRPNAEASKLLIYALSFHAELYIIEGRRPVGNKRSVHFETSQLPIRSNIRTIAGTINHDTSASEIVGAPVPGGFQVRLTSAACLAYVNDRTFSLDQRPQTVSTDQFGRLQIVIPASGGLGAAPIGLQFLPDSSETRVFYIQPAQRVLNALSSLKTGDDLKNAKTSDGRSLFSSPEDHPQENFDQVAQVFANVPAMITAFDPSAMPGPHPPASNLDTTIAWQKREKTSDNDRNWLDAAADVVGTVIAGPVIRLILKIGARIIRFALDTVGTIVTGLASPLEGCFGIDLSLITDFFKFRYKRVVETQKDLAFAVDTAITLSSRYLHHHRETLIDGIDTIGKFFEQLVGSPADIPSWTPEENRSGGFFDNPIISNLLKLNPLSWIMEAIVEELGNDFKILALDLNLAGQIFAALKDQFELLWGFLQRSWTAVRAAITEPAAVMDYLQGVLRDGFWTIFKAIKAIIIRVFDLFLNSYDAITNFCRGKWKIPYLTDLWEELADCDFTLINFVTYVAAKLLELANPTKESLAKKWNIRSAFGDMEKINMPPLLPKSWTDDDTVSLEESQNLFEQQVALTKQGQIDGKLEFAANPPGEPRFGLMAITAPRDMMSLKNDEPSEAVQIVIALARAGKKVSRSANLAVEGLSVGSTGSQSDGASDSGGGFDQDMGSSASTRASSVLSSDDALGSGLLDSGKLGLKSAKAPVSGGTMSVKNILIGTNIFACICQITEQVLMYNKYDEALRSKENFDGNIVELITGILGLFFSFFAENAPIMAMSNFINSAGSLAATCCQPEKDGFSYAAIGASACHAVSSVIFLVKEPTCQTIGWTERLPQIPDEGETEPIPPLPKPDTKGDLDKKFKNVAEAVSGKFAELGATYHDDPPVGDMAGNCRGALAGIREDVDLVVGFTLYKACLDYFNSRKGQVPAGEENGVNFQGTTGSFPQRVA
ncbi:hypothetical protein BCR34DRAFT_628299 [Clohesyomyces aquaticus]|uniref:Uncharacterized protein n=1 Tax=Clohesyomyces aquaticus TaxID=1231657 RepID=A0A1Y1YMK0_9PLEO|nr:hypothetical protein BCR34DRAFT_628299 [Clohesyomyces aquaticus]